MYATIVLLLSSVVPYTFAWIQCAQFSSKWAVIVIVIVFVVSNTKYIEQCRHITYAHVSHVSR